MKNISKKAISLVMILSIAFVSIAQQGNGNQSNRGQGTNQGYCTYANGGQMAAYLDLSEDQQNQINALRLKHQKEMLPLRNQINEMRAKLQTLSTAENADMKAIDAQIDKMSEIKTTMMKSKAAHKQEIRKILTDDQRVLYDMHQGRKGYGKGNGKGQGNGQGCSYGQGNRKGNGQGRGYNRM